MFLRNILMLIAYLAEYSWKDVYSPGVRCTFPTRFLVAISFDVIIFTYKKSYNIMRETNSISVFS